MAFILLSIKPALLCLLGGLDDPDVVWRKSSDENGTNKLQLCKPILLIKLKEGDSVQEHIHKLIQ